MERLLVIGAVALVVGGMGVTRVSDMQEKLVRLDEFSRTSPRKTLDLQMDLGRVRAELETALAELATSRAEGLRSEEILAVRVRALEDALSSASARLEQQGVVLSSAVEQPARIDERIGALEAGVESRWTGLETSLRDALRAVEETRSQLDHLNAEDDVEARWRTIVGPTVQLSGETTVGSGVLLESTPRAADGSAKEGYETLVVTAWHVVRDIIADAGTADPPIPVAIYHASGAVTHETAKLICKEPGIDAALLKLNSDQAVPNGARLASRAELASRRIFHNVYAVGCPLGNDPIPTRGEIADLDHVIDGTSYWMISAPTYIGNSGGGIYDGASGHLLGVFSKIYTHGAIRPTVVPHMGLVSAMDRFYAWLESSGYARIVEDAGFARLVLATKG